MPKKFKLYPKTVLAAICGVAFVTTLTACSSNVAVQKTEDTNSQESIESVETQNNEQTNTENIDTTLETQEEKDSAVETAIGIMLDEADQLSESASNAANSEEVQGHLATSMQNLKDLTDFIFNGSEINGVTFSELSDEGKQKAIDALNTLDETINYLIPNYRERFRDWFTDTTANGLDALGELKDQGLELWDEIQSKRNTK